MGRRKAERRPDAPEANPPASGEQCEEGVMSESETPQERQCRALLQGTPADQKIAAAIYDSEMLSRIKREIESEK
jgi:hypothetical protein